MKKKKTPFPFIIKKTNSKRKYHFFRAVVLFCCVPFSLPHSVLTSCTDGACSKKKSYLYSGRWANGEKCNTFFFSLILIFRLSSRESIEPMLSVFCICLSFDCVHWAHLSALRIVHCLSNGTKTTMMSTKVGLNRFFVFFIYFLWFVHHFGLGVSFESESDACVRVSFSPMLATMVCHIVTCETFLRFFFYFSVVVASDSVRLRTHRRAAV